jgi:hypothetical protein
MIAREKKQMNTILQSREKTINAILCSRQKLYFLKLFDYEKNDFLF